MGGREGRKKEGREEGRNKKRRKKEECFSYICVDNQAIVGVGGMDVLYLLGSSLPSSLTKQVKRDADHGNLKYIVKAVSFSLHNQDPFSVLPLREHWSHTSNKQRLVPNPLPT